MAAMREVQSVRFCQQIKQIKRIEVEHLREGAYYSDLTYEIIGAAMDVHRELGPGLPEKIYENALLHELTLQEIDFEVQKQIRVIYKGVLLGEFFLDLLVDGKVIVELKALSQLLPVHKSQVITYLKASHLKVGLLINFGEPSLAFERIFSPSK